MTLFRPVSCTVHLQHSPLHWCLSESDCENLSACNQIAGLDATVQVVLGDPKHNRPSLLVPTFLELGSPHGAKRPGWQDDENQNYGFVCSNIVSCRPRVYRVIVYKNYKYYVYIYIYNVYNIMYLFIFIIIYLYANRVHRLHIKFQNTCQKSVDVTVKHSPRRESLGFNVVVSKSEMRFRPLVGNMSICSTGTIQWYPVAKCCDGYRWK